MTGTPEMQLRLLSHAEVPHANATAGACLACLPNGVVMEFVDLRTASDTDIASVWVRTVNLRPVPVVTDAALATLRHKLAASDFRLHQLSRAERQLDDLLRALAAGDPDDLVQACRLAQAHALSGFAEGSHLSALAWLALGARFAEHHLALDPSTGERVWRLLRDTPVGGSLALDQLALPTATSASITGAVSAQHRALVQRAEAMDKLRALVG